MRKTKETLIVTTILVSLLCAVSVLAYLNGADRELKKELEIEAEFFLTEGEQSERITMADILAPQPVEFEAVLNTSTTSPTSVKFTGVELSKLCRRYGITLTPSSLIQVNALDGYASVVTGEEAYVQEMCTSASAWRGNRSNRKKEGGFGPYLMVIRDVQFSQRWCKFVEEIVIK